MSLKDSLRGLQGARAEEAVERPDVQASRRLDAQVPKRPVVRDVPTFKRSAEGKLAKSLDPEYERVTVYVRRKTRTAAWRRWEDGGGGDFSELCEELMQRYLSGQ